MIQINLLPWREAARQKKLMLFYKHMGIAASVGVVVIIIMHTHYNGLLAKQNKRNLFLQNQISIESGQVTDLKEKLEQHENVLKQLNLLIALRKQANLAVEFLNELARIVPNGVYFRRVDYKDNRVLVIGRASSNLKITLLLKNISQSGLFVDPNLTEISIKGTTLGEERIFQLTFGIAEKV